MNGWVCRLLFVTVPVILAAGCALGPDYRRPGEEVPGAYRFAPNPSPESWADRGWWEF